MIASMIDPPRVVSLCLLSEVSIGVEGGVVGSEVGAGGTGRLEMGGTGAVDDDSGGSFDSIKLLFL